MESLSPDWQQEAILNLSLFRRQANRSKWYWRGSELKAKSNVCQGLTMSLNLARELGYRPDCASSFLHHLSASLKEPSGTKWQTRTILLESWGGARPPSGTSYLGQTSKQWGLQMHLSTKHTGDRMGEEWAMGEVWQLRKDPGGKMRFHCQQGMPVLATAIGGSESLGRLFPSPGLRFRLCLKPCPLTFILNWFYTPHAVCCQ